MRVTLISGEYPPRRCGIGDYTALLARHLRELGHSVCVVTSLGAPALGVCASVRGWGISSLPRLLRELRSSEPEVVNLQYPSHAFRRFLGLSLLPLGARVALPGVPWALTVHEYLSFTRIGRLRVEALAALADALIVPSQENWEALATRFPGHQDWIRRIPIGPGIEPGHAGDAAAWRAAQGIGTEEKLVVFFGAVSPGKGLETLFAALARPPASYLRPRVAVVGEANEARFGPYLYCVRQAAAPLGDAVAWAGHCAEAVVSTWLAAAELVALPFDDGASSRRSSLLTALAHGCPTVSTAGGTEFRHGRDLLLVQPGDADALSQAIALVLSDAELRQRLSEGAREAASCFAWPRIAASVVDLYEDLLRPLGR